MTWTHSESDDAVQEEIFLHATQTCPTSSSKLSLPWFPAHGNYSSRRPAAIPAITTGSPPGIPSPLTYTDARGRNASREGTICPCSHSEFAGGQLDLFASRSHCNETGTRASLPEDLQTGQLDALSPLDALPPNARAGSASSVSDQPVYKFDGCWESRQRRAPVQVCEKV